MNDQSDHFGDPRLLFEVWRQLTGENLLESPQKSGSEELKK